MYHMKSVTVRDLRYDFPKVERLLKEGKPVRVTKRGKAFARIELEKDSAPDYEPGTAPLPDFMGRLREIFGERVLPVTGAELIREDRDRY